MSISKENNKTVDSFELRDKTNGFEIGVLLCCNYRLRGCTCNQCKSQDKCSRNILRHYKRVILR